MDVDRSNSNTTIGPQVRRLKTLKRGKEGKETSKQEITLQTVLGVTASNNAGLANSPVSGISDVVLGVELCSLRASILLS